LTSATVAAEHFSFWYGEKQALHEIDLTIKPRSVTALIGPSGCGKSTFLRALNRLNDIIPDTRHTAASVSTARTFTRPGSTP
jgi:phosphate transport system ATP-binding protein